MPLRAAASRMASFALMTGTLGVGLFVLTRLGPGSPLTALNAARPDPDRYDARRLEEVLALRERTTQMLGAVAAEPAFVHAAHAAPAVEPPVRDLAARPEPAHGFLLSMRHRANGVNGVAGADDSGDAPPARPDGRATDPRDTPPGSRPLASAGRTIRVNGGESLVAIAERELGSRRMVKRLLDANPHLAAVLAGGPPPEGTELVIPAVNG